MDIAFYQEQVYGRPPCWELVSHVLLRECELIVSKYRAKTSSLRDIANAFRLELHRGDHGFTKLEAPQDFAVVLMGKTLKRGVHHCGIYWQGSVLHALETGTLYQDLASLQAEYPILEHWAR